MGIGDSDVKSWPLHNKNVGKLSLDEVAKLSAADEEVRKRFVEARKWITEEKKYAGIQAGGLHRAKLSVQDVDALVATGKVEAHVGAVRGTVKVTAVPEPAKTRRRVIEETVEINRCIEEKEAVQFASIQERHAAVLRGDTVIDIDFAAFYDQFELDAAIRDYYVFEDKAGRKWHMKVMPMGQRQSVGVAQTTTLQLVNIANPRNVWIEAYIDNVRIVGDAGDVEEVAAEILWRCNQAAVTVNDVDGPRTMEEARQTAKRLRKSSGRWLGEEYDYHDKTVAVAEKTKEKIRACWKARRSWTWKQFAAMVALLFYASRTVNLRLAPYFAALRAYSAASVMLTAFPELWNKKAATCQTYCEEAFERWIDDVLTAGPRVVRIAEKPEVFITTDASKWGWAAMVHRPGGEMIAEACPWTQKDRAQGLDTGRSTQAEPEAIYRALCRAVRPDEEVVVRVATDNSAAVASINRGYSLAFRVNTIVGRIAKIFPRVSVEVVHVAGCENPADRMSRGRKPTVEDWERFRALATEQGGIMGIPSALPTAT